MDDPTESISETYPEHDRVIKLIVEDSDDDIPRTSHALLYEINCQKLSDASSFFKTLLSSDKFVDTGRDTVEITDRISPQTLGTIFDICHQTGITETKLGDMKLQHVRELAAKIDQYLLDISDFRSWFRLWYARNRELEQVKATSLLYPTWDFDHAQAFQRITKYLAYESAGHIKETAVLLPQLHLPERVIGGLNAARGRLKTVLQKSLHSEMQKMLRFGSCPVQATFLFSYLRTLHRLDCWPIEEAISGGLHGSNEARSIGDILRRLKTFPLSPKPTNHICATCPSDWKACVDRAIEKTEKYFDGLCIDCMETSNSRKGDMFRSYWQEWSQLLAIDNKCRVNHGQSSWYHSWLGRPEDRLSNLRRRLKYQRAREEASRG